MKEWILLVAGAIINEVASKVVDKFWNNKKEKKQKKNIPPFVGHLEEIKKQR